MNDKNLKDFLPDKNSSYLKKLNNNDKYVKISKNDVVNQIKTVMDTEIPVNIYDLGLIYKLEINKNNVRIDMTLTTPNCPVAGSMPENVGNAVGELSGISSIEVKLVWEPKWEKKMMSEEAKLALDIF